MNNKEKLNEEQTIIFFKHYYMFDSNWMRSARCELQLLRAQRRSTGRV